MHNQIDVLLDILLAQCWISKRISMLSYLISKGYSIGYLFDSPDIQLDILLDIRFDI